MGASAFTIPTIFTVIDKLSAPLKGMGRNVESFANKFESGIARGERTFNKLTPSLSEASKQFLSFASTAAIVAGIIGGIHFSFNSLKEYGDAVAKFRTIVSDLSDKEFSKFQNKINDVAKDTKESSVTVANSFEMIAGLNSMLAETADGLGSVSKAAIILSQASKDDLGKSASNLVGIMNQFNLAANQSDRVINVLAAGQAVGASSIIQTADAFTVFGAVADSSNLSLEQSVALTEVLASKQIMGAEAGTALRGTLIKLKSAGYGYSSGLFNTKDALSDVKKEYDKLKTAKEKDALLDKVFGTINMTTGTILMNNIKLYDEFTGKVTGTTEAQKAAAINNNTLTKSLERLSNKWVNLITSSDKVSTGMNLFNKAVIFLTDNMEIILTVGALVLGFFLAWKAILITSQVVLGAYNIILGITGALSNTASIAIGKNAIALGAYNVVTKIVTASQWLWNAAMSANPIGLIIIGIIALIALITVIIKYWNDWGAALSIFLGPLGMVISLIQSFRRNWEMIKESFKSGGILEGLKAIGATILDAMIMPLLQLLKIVADLTGADWAKNAANGLEEFRKGLGVNVETDESGNPLPGKELLNPKAAEQDALTSRLETNQKQNVSIDIADKTGRAKVESDNNFVPIKMSSTQGYK